MKNKCKLTCKNKSRKNCLDCVCDEYRAYKHYQEKPTKKKKGK